MNRKKRGFTILELLVVMAIIAILAGLGVKGYNLAKRKAKESRAKADIEKPRTTLNEYRVEFGAYPDPEADETFSREIINILTGENTTDNPRKPAVFIGGLLLARSICRPVGRAISDRIGHRL